MKQTGYLIILSLDIFVNPKIVYKCFCYYAWKGFFLRPIQHFEWLLFFLQIRIHSWFFLAPSSYFVYNVTIHFAWNSLMIPNWKAILTPPADISRFSLFKTSFSINVLYFSEIKDLAALLTEISVVWNFFITLSWRKSLSYRN